MLAVLCALAACQSTRDRPTPASDEAWFRVENESGTEIVEVNLVFSPQGDVDWGVNQLADTILEPEDNFRLREVPCPDTFDMRAVNAAGAETAQTEVSFPCGEITIWQVTEFP